MNIGNYLKLNTDKPSTAAGDRQQRLENRRDRFDQFFDKMQEQAIAEGDSKKAQKIFEVSEMIEGRLDKRLDQLEEKSGDMNWRRRLDNAFDERQMAAYDKDDSKKAEEIFGLSQDVSGGFSSSEKGSLLEKFLTAFLDIDADKSPTQGTATTNTSTSTEATATSNSIGSSTVIPITPGSTKTTGTA